MQTSNTPTPTGQAVLKTLLLSDLVDSTALVESLGDARAFEVFGAHDRIARDLLKSFHGREIDKTDGFLLLFERPIDAVGYALAYHRAMADLSDELGVSLASRVGIHLGEVFLRENAAEDVVLGAKPLEVEGLAKPMAARIMSAAIGAQTLMTQGAFDLARRAAVDDTEASHALHWMAHGHYVLKGVDEPIPVFEVGEQGIAPLEPPPDSAKVQRVGSEQTILGWRPAPGLEIPHRPRWRVVNKLGEGGFGEVWLAEHSKTREQRVFKFCFEVERLKGLQREVTLFRLLKETLGHRSDIARIIDWNFEQAPYFLESEYTEGGSLVDWAAARGGVAELPLGQRLEIVAQIADALAAAHSVGVLHKDIKPANILISEGREGEPRARLTDFGIGLVTDPESLAQHGITMLGFSQSFEAEADSATGTLRYLAPELLEGRPATVQADVFSLGMICFQLVVGRLDRILAPGWEREIADSLLREDIAAMVDGVPEQRIADAGEVARRLRSLEDRRQQLAEATRQREEAEAARQALERSRKRRKVALVAGIALAGFSLVMSYQAYRISQEARRANREAATAREVSDFLVGIFAVADPREGRGRRVTARELLDQGAIRVRTELADQPLTQARLMHAMGLSYLQLGLYDQAAPLLQQARELRLEKLGPGHLELASSERSLGMLAAGQGAYGEALEHLQRAREVLEEQVGPEHPELAELLLDLAEVYRMQGRYAEALPIAEQAATITGSAVGMAESSRAGSAAVDSRILSVHRAVDLPGDVSTVLGTSPRGDVVVAVGSQGLYQIDLGQRLAPILNPLAAEYEVVGFVKPAAVVLRRGTGLVLRPLFTDGADAAERVLLSALEDGDRVFVDRHGRRVAVLRGRELRVYGVEEGSTALLATFPLSEPPENVVLSDHFVAWVDRSGVQAGEFSSGAILLTANDWSGRAGPMALHDATGTLAVGGFFDEVVVYRLRTGRPPTTVALPGQTGSLVFLHDFPSLLVAKEGLLAVWREEQGLIASIEMPGAKLVAVDFAASGLLVHDELGQTVRSVSYRSFPIEREVPISSAHLWAMAGSAEGDVVFAGASDGRLHRYDLEAGSLLSVTAHTQGVTSILARDQMVVTGSDDKSIATWGAQDLRAGSSTRAHDYLVNFMYWEAATDSLWSSSSDGKLKQWSWPQLEQRAVIQVDRSSKASFWIDSHRGRALVGTWNHRWLALRRQPEWAVAERWQSPSEGGYVVLELAAVRALLLLGVHPSGVWIYDLEADSLHQIEDLDLQLGWAVRIADDTAALLGNNCIATYGFQRTEQGLEYELSVGLNTDLGDSGVGAALSRGERVAVGSSDGRLLFVKTGQLPDRVLVSSALR